MKSPSLLGLVLSFAGVAVACGDTQTGPNPDQQVAVPQPDPPAVKEPVKEPEPVPVPKPECTASIAPSPTCSTTKAAPVSQAAISKFVKDAAVPIRCGTNDSNTAWNVAPLTDLYGTDNKIFMMGEVHGTNEIGIVSSLVFEELVKKKLVNVVAFEMPMDVESAYQRYVDTGQDAMAEQLFKYLAPNFFGTLLPKTARDLAAKSGVKLKVGAVDIPQNPAIAVSAIQDVATKLTTQQNTNLVLETLPTTLGGGGGSGQFSPEDITAANNYFDHIMANKTAICSELSAADCDRLIAMTHALWASTLSYNDAGDSELWFARREEVIYYNLKTKIAAPTDRMFLHMGAAHTNKHTFSAGSRMTKEYTLTKDLVFSVAPAWDDGSVIWYGEDVDLPAEPASINNALGSDTHPAFLSTTRLTNDCEKNPVGAEPEDRVGHNNNGTRSELYDGYIHYGKLTSEREPDKATLKRDPTASSTSTSETGTAGGKDARPLFFDETSLVAFRARIERKERAALKAKRERLGIMR